MQPATVLRWAVGPLDLFIGRRSGEWELALKHEDDPLSTRLEPAALVGELPPDLDGLRCATTSSSSGYELVPRLADRALVVRPEKPFHVLPNESADLFVSTPVWIVVRTVDGDDLMEAPTTPLRETWFGTTTQSGSLCYSIRTKARRSADALPRCPHRASTKIRIENGANDLLRFERIRLPVDELGVFQSRSALWTHSLVVRRSGDSSGLDVHLDREEPALADKTLVGEPRSSGHESGLRRALNTLLLGEPKA